MPSTSAEHGSRNPPGQERRFVRAANLADSAGRQVATLTTSQVLATPGRPWRAYGRAGGSTSTSVNNSAGRRRQTHLSLWFCFLRVSRLAVQPVERHLSGWRWCLIPGAGVGAAACAVSPCVNCSPPTTRAALPTGVTSVRRPVSCVVSATCSNRAWVSAAREGRRVRGRGPGLRRKGTAPATPGAETHQLQRVPQQTGPVGQAGLIHGSAQLPWGAVAHSLCDLRYLPGKGPPSCGK